MKRGGMRMKNSRVHKKEEERPRPCLSLSRQKRRLEEQMCSSDGTYLAERQTSGRLLWQMWQRLSSDFARGFARTQQSKMPMQYDGSRQLFCFL